MWLKKVQRTKFIDINYFLAIHRMISTVQSAVPDFALNANEEVKSKVETTQILKREQHTLEAAEQRLVIYEWLAQVEQSKRKSHNSWLHPLLVKWSPLMWIASGSNCGRYRRILKY